MSEPGTEGQEKILGQVDAESVAEEQPPQTDAKIEDGDNSNDDEDDEVAAAAKEKIRREREARAQALTLEIIGDLPFAEVRPPENVLFVCKLNPVTQDSDLELIFSRFGKILSCEIIRDRTTGDSLQYAFIEFDDKKACETAYFKMQDVLIDDRRIHVDFSQSVSKLSDVWRKDANTRRRKQARGRGGWGGVKELEKWRKYRNEEVNDESRYKMVHGEDELKGQRANSTGNPEGTSEEKPAYSGKKGNDFDPERKPSGGNTFESRESIRRNYRERSRSREREMDRERNKERDRDRDRDRDRGGDRERNRERGGERNRERERGRDRGRGRDREQDERGYRRQWRKDRSGSRDGSPDSHRRANKYPAPYDKMRDHSPNRRSHQHSSSYGNGQGSYRSR